MHISEVRTSQSSAMRFQHFAMKYARLPSDAMIVTGKLHPPVFMAGDDYVCNIFYRLLSAGNPLLQEYPVFPAATRYSPEAVACLTLRYRDQFVSRDFPGEEIDVIVKVFWISKHYCRILRL